MKMGHVTEGARAVTSPLNKEMYVGEKFRVWIIRRDYYFWTGTKWELAPYTAKLFSSEKDAQKYITRRKLNTQSSTEKVTVRPATLHHQ
jgi:hypothetical protein